MSGHVISLNGVLSVSILVFALPGPGNAHEPSIDAIVSQHRKNCDYESALTHVSAASSMVINGKAMRPKKCDVFRNDGNFLVVINNEFTRVIYKNGSYCTINQDGKDSPYVLISLSKGVSAEDFSAAESTRRKLIFPTSQFSTGLSLGQILTSSSFKARRVIKDDNDLVTIVFESSLPGADRQRAINGSLAFDPKKDCNLVKYEIDYINAAPAPSTTDKGVRTLIQRNGHYAVSEEKVDSYFTKEGKKFQTILFEYSYETKAPAPDEQYDLSFYGISPPVDTVYEDRKFNWPLWGSLGVALIMASLVLAYVARRRKRPNIEG